MLGRMSARRLKSYLSKIFSPVVSLSLVLVVMAALCVPLQVFGQGVASRTPSAKTAPETPSMPQKAPAPQISDAIPVPEIAAKAAEATSRIRDIGVRLPPTAFTESIGLLLPQKAEQVNRQLSETRKILQGESTLSVLQNQQHRWQQIRGDIDIWLQVLTKRATLIGDDLNELLALETVWSKTLDEALKANAPQPILQQVKDVITSVSAEKRTIQAQRVAVLVLQSKVAHVLAQCDDVLVLISQMQQKVVGGIFTQKSSPVWKPRVLTYLANHISTRIGEIAPEWRREISDYLQKPALGLPLHIGLFVVLAFLFCMVRRSIQNRKVDGTAISSRLTVFELPFAAALFLTLSVASAPNTNAPPIVKVIYEILLFAPIIRLVRDVVNRQALPVLYTLWVLFALDAVRQELSGGLYGGQLILILETLTGAAVLLRVLVSGYINVSSSQAGKSLWKSFKQAVAIVAFITLTVGFFAGMLGYLSLARILAAEVIAGATMAVGLYAFLRMAIGAVSFSLVIWPLRYLHMVKSHRALIERRIYVLLVWLAAAIFVYRLLTYTGFLNPTLSFFESVLAFRFERGSVSISVEDIVAFLVTVWAAYLLSALLRFILQEDVYPRIGVQKGLAYATSSLINYVILALGFVVGLGVIGVSLTKITVLAGAFGVGIGFGLQSIVNNFVSGLILLFERPIHVGDSIEMDGLKGEVRRIGIRASTVRTWQGADIVVPNADLVTKQVTNWTLSDKLRRVDLPVGVNYGANPEEVIRILVEAANAHPDVLKFPAPTALFTGYGDSAINFELRAWTDKFNDWPIVRSDLVRAIYHAGYKAGLSFPFPQREVHIINDSGKGQSSGSLAGSPNRIPAGKERE